VLTNLFGNAVKHGGGAIGVAGRERGGWVAISVADDGPGISPDDLPHVFERFYRGSDRRSGSEGAGLGLAIARGLTERMGGSIVCSSRPGEGTTFTIELPAAGS
jgi:two-component system sensor histidine kinase MtrB